MAGPRKKVERGRRTCLLTVRVRPEHLAMFHQAAARYGISTSAWVTERLLMAAEQQQSESTKDV